MSRKQNIPHLAVVLGSGRLLLIQETSLDVTGDPKTSGVNGESLRMTDFLVPIMGNEFAAKDFKERTDEEKDKFAYWCNLFKWYSLLKRLGFEPTFGDS